MRVLVMSSFIRDSIQVSKRSFCKEIQFLCLPIANVFRVSFVCALHLCIYLDKAKGYEIEMLCLLCTE